jgi:hypothetical protein
MAIWIIVTLILLSIFFLYIFDNNYVQSALGRSDHVGYCRETYEKYISGVLSELTFPEKSNITL